MNKYVAEFLGTLFFVYIFISVGNPLAIAAALLVSLAAIGPISGGYLNPAVSVMMVSAGKLPSSELMPYVLSQVAGGLAAFELHKRIL
jgi:aquaporin Z